MNVVTEDGRVRLCDQKCSSCIFRGGNLMRLRAGRVKQMVEEATKKESAIICHQTLDKEQQAVCRGFFEAHRTQPLQVAERLDRLVEVSASSLV